MNESGIARIFMHGRSQAVRLPLAFRLPGDRVRVRRVEGGILLEPMVADLDAWFRELDRFADDTVHGGRPSTTANARRRGLVRLTYLLDTNVVIALVRNKPARVRERFRAVVSEGGLIIVSSVVLFELWYGVARSERPEENSERLRIFLSGVNSVLPFDEGDASIAGDLRPRWRWLGRDWAV